MKVDRVWPLAALPLLLFWTLFNGSGTWSGFDGNCKSLAACIAEGKKQVESADARKEEERRDRAAIERAHPGHTLITSEDYDVGWECISSDGSSRTYGGYWKTKANRPKP
jgi:hypothetical protein